jgi:hypothetical protein
MAEYLLTATTSENVSSTSRASQVSLTNLYVDKTMLVSRADERNLFAAICLSLDSANAEHNARRSRFSFAALKLT